MVETMTTVGELVSEIYQEVLGTYGDEAAAAVITAMLVDQLVNGCVIGGPTGK